MSAKSSIAEVVNWQEQAHQYLVQGHYGQAANLYEQAIIAEPEVKSHYWHLGLLLLLQEQEAEAQMTWLLAMAEGAEQVDLWTVELVEVLQTEAQRREELADYSVAWAIRQHGREISPTDINNLLHLIYLTIKLEKFTSEELNSFGVIELLQSQQTLEAESELLLQVLESVLDAAPLHPSTLEFTAACLAHIQDSKTFINILMPAAIEIAYSAKQPTLAIRFAEICLRLDAENTEVLQHLSALYQNVGDYSKGIETAKLCYSLMQTLPEKVVANYLLLRGLMGAGGYWEEACAALHQHEILLLSLTEEQTEEQPELLNQPTVSRVFTSTYFAPYFADEPKKSRYIQNQVGQFCQNNVQMYAKEQAERYRHKPVPNRTKPLKIGYLSHCFSRHSVGWLARWIFQHHDRDSFKINAYFINYKQADDPLQEWYVSQVDQAYKSGMESLEIAEKIYQDEIDILIDLDSITLDVACEIMALKPAPIQVTWLGWDASGLPAIDYFIADPYILPESAQDYYTEKIWRLPHTYIAVDGFEVGVPTLRRDQLDIPGDAVVYLSAQRGYKRHPDTTRSQIKIIKEVPNSYFLIKGTADEESIKSFFNQIAEEEGVDCDRLRFLPDAFSEATHRANLGIADVVLDTYPYNGATTTLETLWMGIPLVTRVGQQFAARNSYTMMINAGVTEGIAWTDKEYIEWGVRLGEDPALRQQISWQLRRSRQTAPLWNGRQFTREMEQAYTQMWQRYIEARS